MAMKQATNMKKILNAGNFLHFSPMQAHSIDPTINVDRPYSKNLTEVNSPTLSPINSSS